MERNPTFVPVVAGALIDRDGRVLLQRRRLASAHGGLWEFPGGKIESGETAEGALVRELHEELGVAIAPQSLLPVTFACDPVQPPLPRQPHVILLFACRDWAGEPHALDAEVIGWFAPKDVPALPMPPLDYPLARALEKAI